MGRRTKGEYVAIETDDEAEDAPPKLSPSAPLLGDGTSAPATGTVPFVTICLWGDSGQR